MRLRNRLTVGVIVFLLTAIGTIGIVVNRSALRAADDVHRADSRALGVNNALLAGQLQLLSAAELRDFAASHSFALASGDGRDRAALARFSERSDYFRYGAAITDLSGAPLTASRDTGLPAPSDPGLAPLRGQLLAGRPGFSSLMDVGGVRLTAVAVPIVVDGAPAAVLVGFVEPANSQLQAYVSRLSAPEDLIALVDGNGRIVAASDPATNGTSVDPAVSAALRDIPADNFVEYETGGTKMITVLVGGIPGGWAYARTQTRESFDGVVYQRNQTITLTLLSMLAVGGLGIALIGYRAQLQRRRADERFRALVQHAPDVVAVLDGDGRALYASPSAGEAVGVPADRLLGASIFDFVHPDDNPGIRAHFDHLLADPDAVLRLQCRIVRADGQFRWFEFTASNQLRNPSLTGVVVNARDITDSRTFQERLAHQAMIDPLTGLANRRRMHDTLRALLADQPVAVLFLDLDGFKPVNDTFGHQTGDEVLRQVAARLNALVRPNELLARIGGDEFVLLMPGVVRWAEAETLARQLRRAVEQPITVGGEVVHIGASVGVHVATPADNPDHVLRAADHAMYAIKRAGGERPVDDALRMGHPTRAVPAGRHRAWSDAG